MISNYIDNINNYYLLLTNHAQFNCDAMYSVSQHNRYLLFSVIQNDSFK